LKRYSLLLCLSLGVLMIVAMSGCHQPTATYLLTVTAGNGGTTDPAPGTHEYDQGASVSVRATAHAGFAFAHWEGNASGGGNPVTVVMDADKTVTAVFAAQSEGEGEVVEGEGEIAEGEVVEGETVEGESMEGEGEAVEGETAEGEVGEGEGETVEGEGETVEGEAQRDVGILIDTYLGEESLATGINPNPIAGRVMVFDAGTMPTTLHWLVKNSTGETSGDVSVDGTGAWNVTPTLADGDNSITFTVPETPAVKTLNLTYTPGYSFGAPLYVTPDVAYVNEDDELTALITLNDPNTNPADVKLFRVDGGAGEEIATLTDTGDTANGDEAAGDGIYACKFHLTETAEGTVLLRVRVGLAGGAGSAVSETADVMVVRHWLVAEIQPIIEQMNGYQQRIDNAAGEEEKKAICGEAVDALKNDPAVVDCGLNPDNWGMWVEYKNGYKSGLLLKSPGFMGKGTAAKTTALTLDFLRHKSSPYQEYVAGSARPAMKSDKPNHPVGSKGVYVINLYAEDIRDDQTAFTKRLTDYGFDTKNMPKIVIATGAEEPQGVLLLAGVLSGYYGIIDINTHGTLWGKEKTVVFVSGDPQRTEIDYVAGTVGDLWEPLIRRGQIVVIDGVYAATPRFMGNSRLWFPRSLVLANCCYSAHNSSMALAFFNRNAGAYLGYSKPTTNNFCRDMDNKLLDTLLISPDKTLADAFVPGQFDPYVLRRVKQAEYRMFGDPALSLSLGILDGGFENTDLDMAWTVTGDARRISVFGLEAPAAGKGMARLLQDSSISQTFYCGGNAQDFVIGYKNYFRVNTCSSPMYWRRGVLSFRIEEVDHPESFFQEELYPCFPMHQISAPLLGTIPCDFDSGPWITDWCNGMHVPIPAVFQNKMVRLTVSFVRGDKNVFTDAVLLDNISVYP